MSSDIRQPIQWMNLVTNMGFDGFLSTAERTDMCRMKIIKEIGLIVRCYCNPSEQFFLREEHWYSTIYPFLTLVNTLEVLLKCDGTTQFTIQAMSWETYLPDCSATSWFEV